MTWKLIVLFISAMLIYNGFDGCSVNKDLVEYSISEIENKGIGDDRYIKITDAYATGEYVYSFGQHSQSNVEGVIFPLISEQKLAEYIKDSKNIKINVLVKRNTKRFSSDCASKEDCIDDVVKRNGKGYSVYGVTRVGLNDVDDETKKLLSSSGFGIANQVVFLEEDTEPSGSLKSILMVVGGIIGIAFVVLISFGSDDETENKGVSDR